jgi:hypothetical protein
MSDLINRFRIAADAAVDAEWFDGANLVSDDDWEWMYARLNEDNFDEMVSNAVLCAYNND